MQLEMVLRRILCPFCLSPSSTGIPFLIRSFAISAEKKRQPQEEKEEKAQKKKVRADCSKASPDLAKFLDSPRYDAIREQLPKYLLHKYKTPEYMCLIDKETALSINKVLTKNIRKDDIIIEVNPGLGLLTKEMLRTHTNEIFLYEISQLFATFIMELQDQYPGRLHYKIGDFFGMWKLAFKDKLDDGNRVQNLIGDLINSVGGKGVKIVGAMPSISFIKHLMSTILFHNANTIPGRPEMYIALSSYDLSFLKEDGTTLLKNMFRTTPALFHLLFDYTVLAKVPRDHFLPWKVNSAKKATLVDNDSMFIVRLRQKEKLPCEPDYLPLLWFFFRPQMMHNSNRVIPTLEQWIPGAGVWLITGQDPPDTNHALGPTLDDAPLPHITIFTEFRDLSLRQKLTVFKRFISWPEFDACPFRVNMENNLPRSVVGLGDEKELTNSSELEDVEEEKEAE